MDLYDSPPELNRCGLYYVHIDERACSVTLGFETSHLPARPHLEWQTKDFNTFQFYLQFDAASQLRVTGWNAPAQKTVLMSGGNDGRLRFSARGPGSLLEFTAGQVEVTRTHTYLASAAP
ncbi:Imm50 family immunity protein [Streptomyces endophyticus]|uniref:Immunity 50 family protein n=1 Tax=Streptomyces endophyticus TaxID=714166 RepID=A0ABU6F6I7_9ACTN|nr:Imm50 family immunity protein [Streptomyces endophyticus]MEB8339625.1 immunity 50 family protein [Streptomyces endophyticus]